MNKTLTAALIASTCGFASAQSSVTIYGIVDVAVSRASGNLASSTSLETDSMNSSRLGFQGSEDLGGGNYAGFVLEGTINVDSGTGGSNNTNNQTTGAVAGNAGFNFNRRAYVSLRGGWGEVRAGRDYTPSYSNKSGFATMGTNGVGGTQATQGIGGITATRASNSIAYWLPRLNGFYGTAMHFRGENSSNAANADDGTGTGFRLGWAGGPVNVAFGTNKTSYLTGDIRTNNVGASYNAGVALFKAMYTKDKISTGVEGQGGSAGVEFPFGPHTVRTAYSFYERETAGTKVSKLAAGYLYSMSKRTQLYTTIARLSNSGGSSAAFGNARVSPNGNSTGFDLGVSHSF